MNTKNILAIIFAISLSTWVISGIYLSVNFLISNFIDLNPTTSKTILSFSFIFALTSGVFNKLSGNPNFLRMTGNDKEGKTESKPTCKTCKKR